MDKPRWWTLEGHTPIPCWDAIEWGKWLETADRHVAQDVVQGIEISTVFMGRDHNFYDDGPPILFETMCRGDGEWLDETQIRYATWEEAETGHQRVVEMLRSSPTPVT